MIKKFVFTGSVLLLIFSATLGISAKNSFTDIVSSSDARNNAIAYRQDEEMPDEEEFEGYKVIAESFNECDLIAVVSFGGERIYEHYSTKSTVNISAVLQGDTTLVGKKIELYEPSFFYFDINNVLCYRPTSNCTLMAKDKAYIIFAKKRKYSDNKPKYLSDDVYIYSNQLLPYIPLDRANVLVIKENNSLPLTFGDICVYDLVCSSETQKERYLKATEQIMNQYGVGNQSG